MQATAGADTLLAIDQVKKAANDAGNTYPPLFLLPLHLIPRIPFTDTNRDDEREDSKSNGSVTSGTSSPSTLTGGNNNNNNHNNNNSNNNRRTTSSTPQPAGLTIDHLAFESGRYVSPSIHLKGNSC